MNWNRIKFSPRPRREEIKPLTPEQCKPIMGKRTEIRDYSYHAADGSLQAVSIRKADGEQPTICINGANYPLGWLNG